MKAEIAAKPIAKQPADPWKVETAGRTSEMFTAVRDFDDLARERFRSALRKAGRGPSTRLTFSVRWEDAMRLMAGEWLNGRGEHSLDWFHLRRRIEWLGRSIHWAVDYGDRDGMAKLTRNRRNLRSPRWNLWHYGGSRHARWMIALSHLGAQLRSDRNVLDGVNDTRHLGGNGCERLAPEIRIVAILGDVALEFVSKSVLSLADRNLSAIQSVRRRRALPTSTIAFARDTDRIAGSRVKPAELQELAVVAETPEISAFGQDVSATTGPIPGRARPCNRRFHAT